MFATYLPNADAIRELADKLHIEEVDIFFMAGRISCPTYSRASAAVAYDRFRENTERELPEVVLSFCHSHRIFPEGTI